MRGYESQLCPLASGIGSGDDDASNNICLWPSRLSLTLDAHGGKFSLSVEVYREANVPLPGGDAAWPQEVRVDGQSAPVVGSEHAPSVFLRTGEHAIAGNFSWSELPESIHVPARAGPGRARSARSQRAPFPAATRTGFSGCSAKKKRRRRGRAGSTSKSGERSPMRCRCRSTRAFSWRSRGESRGAARARAPRWIHSVSLDSELPARLEADGRLRVQVRPGTFHLELVARHRGDVTSLTLPKDESANAGPWAGEEIWTFAARPDLRVVEIVGVQSIDPLADDAAGGVAIAAGVSRAARRIT